MFIDDGLKGFVIKFNLEYTEESHNSHNYPIYIYILYAIWFLQKDYVCAWCFSCQSEKTCCIST